ncbi:MAG: aminodeoxychorismate lyase [Pelagibacteraceae bacterium]|mgnify:CR=1 FL=1|nr:aminodeoxychorismate lyase [Pelagibacteraceae bacterium]|tara:strand:- start:683 stop:1498 length:816 start_codon:yes stop_codon:yes gene_type:complete
MFQINGKLTSKINIKDRAVQYGDGVFETIAVKENLLEFWKDHYQRLKKGCKILKIKCPSELLLKKEINKFLKKEKKKKFILKIIISRGEGGRGYCPPKNAIPTRILGSYNWPVYPEANYKKGVKIGICKLRISSQPYLSEIKHLNRLEQIIARSEWKTKNISESLMLDFNENIIEGTMSNIFGVKKNVFYTPIVKFSGVEGIMRKLILKLLKEKKKKYKIKKIKLNELLNFEEVFICNSIFGIWPVRQILKKKFHFGKKTKEIIDLLNKKN